MPRHELDKSSKWLIQRHPRGILLLGGARDARICRALQAELVQPRQLPDGLLEVVFQGRKKPDYFLVEINTYPEKRVAEQAADDLMLAYQHFRVLPELLTVLLHPRGKYRVTGRHEVRSRLQWSQLGSGWKVAELWTLPAEELLEANEVGVIPWVPLAKHERRPEALLEECRRRIEQQAHPADQANLLAVSQILAGLRYPHEQLLAILGGREIMFGPLPPDVITRLRRVHSERSLTALHTYADRCLHVDEFRTRLLSKRRGALWGSVHAVLRQLLIESPHVKRLLIRTTQDAIIRLLEARFGPLPREVTLRLRATRSDERLDDILEYAGQCPDVETFHKRLRN
jgi:hypothetical protein